MSAHNFWPRYELERDMPWFNESEAREWLTHTLRFRSMGFPTLLMPYVTIPVSSEKNLTMLQRTTLPRDFTYYDTRVDSYIGIRWFQLAGHCLKSDGHEKDIFYWDVCLRLCGLEDLT